jgi:hypothetical protein
MNNYLLNQCCKPSTPYRSPDAAIVIGQQGTRAFTVNMVSPKMIVCYWQPGMSEVAYNEKYQDYIADCQRELQRVTG